VHTVRARFFFALTLAAALAACRPASHAPSGETTAVGRAQLYRTGQPAYDRYFDAVYQLQLEVARVPAERRATRAELAHALGLLPDAPAPRVVEMMHERAVDAGKDGYWFRVEGYRAVTEGKEPETQVRAIGHALDACLRAEAAAVDRLRQVPERARALWDLTRRVEMGLDADFFGFRRKEVRGEVAAVKRVLRALSNQGTEQMLEGEKFVLDLTAAVSPGGVSPRPGDVEVADKRRAPGGARKHGAGAEPSAAEPVVDREPLSGRPAPKPAAKRPAAAERPVAAAKPAAERPAPATKPAVERPAPAAKPATKPAGKPAGDDFNP
jgi:hypothetical protein